jgi:hypothetical protein
VICDISGGVQARVEACSALFFGVAVFFAAGGEEDAREEDRYYDRDDEKRGINVHRLRSLLIQE